MVLVFYLNVIRVCTYNVRTGPYVQCTYMSVRILYVNELITVDTVNYLFLRRQVDSYGNLHFKLYENSIKFIP